MQQIHRSLLAPALALALLAAAGVSSAQTGPTSPSGSGSVSSDQEVRRGVPGVDVDVGTRDRGPNAGVPGVDVDVRNPNRATGDADTRRSGAAASTTTRTTTTERQMRADRN